MKTREKMRIFLLVKKGNLRKIKKEKELNKGRSWKKVKIKISFI